MSALEIQDPLGRETIAPLLVGKRKLWSAGLRGIYVLKNGWRAEIQRAESHWRHGDYWTIKKDGVTLGAGSTLERALRNTIMHGGHAA